ncbi:MAG TPA: hypothetical protein VHT03_02095 [Rhizomicrobium sp.]|jgi:hypothetical protein|nr:hypothetical protein [Rhizomicrobium sp.]
MRENGGRVELFHDSGTRRRLRGIKKLALRKQWKIRTGTRERACKSQTATNAIASPRSAKSSIDTLSVV